MDKPVIAVGIRQLVEFSIHGEDLTPGGGLQRMVEGSRAHRSRQKAAVEEGYRPEVSLSINVEGYSLDLTISGRADALFERNGLLVVEEIKLTPFTQGPLVDPLPEHMAQALCYGHILCRQQGYDRVCLRVLYVDASGAQTAVFEETRGAASLARGFEDLVSPMLAWQEARLAHKTRRNESLLALPFPFPAYRAGQRDFCAQVYYAIHLKKRLLAQAPTGTGKTLATLYPALKALAEDKTGQIFYLTARTTGRALAMEGLSMLREQGGHFFALELTAKDKVCRSPGCRCHPDECPRARGFFLRLPEGIGEMEKEVPLWSRAEVERVADRHLLCPFEFSLALAETADVVVCDYNYAFDPGARLRRVFLFRRDLSLLVDEAHHLVERARDMYSAGLGSGQIRLLRRLWGKARGRSNALYQGLTAMLRTLEGLRQALPEGGEATLAEPPEGLLEQAANLLALMGEQEPLAAPEWGDLWTVLLQTVLIGQEYDATYVTLLAKQGKELSLGLFCLDPAPKLTEITKKLQGTVYFSATLSPLPGYARLLGMEAQDGQLALPSPFPPDRLLVMRRRINTRYHHREASAAQVARDLVALLSARRGNYLMMFPSYAYLRRVRQEIEALEPDLRLLVQHGQMDEADRDAFLAAFVPSAETLLGLVVMGGVFAEGIDLPGERLSGVIVVGIGLPQICQEREALRAYFQREMGDGFLYAYRIPGLTKVVQAAGRVIRTPMDLGVVLLLDDRFFTPEVERLMPVHWRIENAGDIPRQTRSFWAYHEGPRVRPEVPRI